MSAVHGSSRNDFKSYSSTLTVGLHTEGESATPVRLRQDRQFFIFGAMVYAASRPTRSEGRFNSASAKFFHADTQQTSTG